MGSSCLEGCVTLCVQFTFQNLPNIFYTTTLSKYMINTIFDVFAKSTLGTINNNNILCMSTLHGGGGGEIVFSQFEQNAVLTTLHGAQIDEDKDVLKYTDLLEGIYRHLLLLLASPK